ncbi:hypothetical protein BV898_16305 [Hypsibius exemplaris]|uniref:Uncharacterized protein n=1 Tax=Hypsibius exemplaris TaxID=2072580 RepID=A0A9X6RL01_HYPEX|nr:hypothetical protein BV898_16305 [Hypsibius exemplaris]
MELLLRHRSTAIYRPASYAYVHAWLLCHHLSRRGIAQKLGSLRGTTRKTVYEGDAEKFAFFHAERSGISALRDGVVFLRCGTVRHFCVAGRCGMSALRDGAVFPRCGAVRRCGC